MAQFPITAYDRPGIAMGQLTAGDPLAAMQALIAPETLGPSKLQRSMLGKLKDIGKSNPFLRGLMSIATDPLVIISLFLSSKYPVVGARKMFEYGRKWAGYTHTPGFLEGLFGRAERIFAGTNVPKLMLKSTEGVNNFTGKWGGKLSTWMAEYEKSAGHPMTYQENLRLGAKLGGLDKPGLLPGMREPLLAKKVQLTPALQRFHDHMAGEFFPSFYDDVVAPLKASKAGTMRIHRLAQQAGFSVEHLMEMQKGGPIAQYFPRTLIRTPQMGAEYANAILEASKGDPKQLAQMFSAAAESQMSGHALPRFGVIAPAMKEVALLGGANPRAVAEIEKMRRAHAGAMASQATNELTRIKQRMAAHPNTYFTQDAMTDFGRWMRSRGMLPGKYHNELQVAYDMFERLDMPGVTRHLTGLAMEASKGREYSSLFLPVMNNYVQSFARPFVWSVEKIGAGLPGLHESMTLGVAVNREVDRLPWPSQRMMRTDYVPIMQGQLTESQASGMLRWSNMKLKAIGMLQDNKGVGRLVPQGTKDKLLDMLTKEKGNFSYLNAQGKIAGYFYYSALGFNPASAFQNMLQPLITTLPLVGTKATWQGLGTTMKKLGGKDGYFSLRQRGVAPHDAMAKAFPEFVKSGLGPEPLSESILRGSLEEMWAGAKNMPVSGWNPKSQMGLQKVKRAALGMFSATERFNRLWSYEAGLAKAKLDGLYTAGKVTQGAQEFAAGVVRATQFPAGPGQMPRALLRLSAPWRQFLYFPIRYAGFLSESTLMGGAGTRNWGTLGRALGASAITNRVTRDVLGIDISKSLMLGALPIPDYERAPFYPLPFVPPIAGIMGAGAQALLQQTTRPLGGIAALMVPGGIQARRLYRTLSPKYAGYGERTPDGKIPVYGDNRALIGNMTPMQLFLRAAGLKPAQGTTEQDLSKYLLRHRDAIRELRREYVEALVGGNASRAQSLREQFRRQYPSLGELTVKESDLRAAQDRRSIDRLGRLMKTMPAGYRAPFQEVVNTAMAGYTGDMFQGQEPLPMSEGWSAPTMDFSPPGARSITPGFSPNSAYGF